ncbi:MAG: sugar phosphate isomerase/epimerase [Verrucomicrobia bacterium]|nr:MAG: sugar phosphate isomerase/epimerase [Verrucomicrobiota bacterium]
MKTAVTLCRVAEAAAGPFVFHDELPIGFAKAQSHGFDAVELFLPSAEEVSIEEIQQLQQQHSLEIAAVGTGAGMVKHGLSLTDADPLVREKALNFIIELVHFAGKLGAPAILGSMQGRFSAAMPRDAALDVLANALKQISQVAATYQQRFIYEPLNRYETNLFHRIGDAAHFVREHQLTHVTLLADLFHMNIEERSLEQSIREHFSAIGHIHFADSNRQAMGFGHTNAASILRLLEELDYQGYLSAEILPLPTADAAAAQFILSTQL